MKIRISTLSYDGLPLEFTLDLEPLNIRVNEGDSGGIVFLEAPTVNIVARATEGGASVLGSVTAICQQPCSTCSESVRHTMNVPIQWTLLPRSESVAQSESFDDVGVITYSGDHADLEDALQEALILNLSPFWHPKRDDEEKCLLCDKQCGLSWKAEGEDTTSIKALLAKAAEKKKTR